MELNWFESILYGLFSGLADVLPVSAQAHRLILLKLFGESGESVFLRLLIHIGTLAALYYSSQNQIIRYIRARKLAMIPKRKRKRPLDTRTLMDFKMLRTALIPVVIGFFFYQKAEALGSNLLLVALFLVINGIILYVPQFLPGSNKDSRSMTPVEALLIGLGGSVSVLPGISCIGSVTSVATVCGAEKTYSFNTALLLAIPVTVGLIIFDIVAIAAVGIGSISFGVFLCYLLAAGAAFGGVLLGVKIMRLIAENIGYAVFGLYSWSAALFAVFLYLTI